jgi:hypothetical protein
LSALAPAGVMPTRDSLSFISLGTPMIMKFSEAIARPQVSMPEGNGRSG